MILKYDEPIEPRHIGYYSHLILITYTFETTKSLANKGLPSLKKNIRFVTQTGVNRYFYLL